MDPDNFKEAWQTQPSPSRLAIDAEQLLSEMRRKQQCFDATIFWRDVREVGTSLVLIPVWIWLGFRQSLPWTWYLMVPALLWIAAYMLVDRIRHKRKPPESGEPLRLHVERALGQVEHQMRLLRKIFWWYLLPLALPMMAYVVQVSWQERGGGWLTALSMGAVVAIVGIVFAGVYWVNLYAVRAGLEPRRRELQTLLTSLADEPADASG